MIRARTLYLALVITVIATVPGLAVEKGDEAVPDHFVPTLRLILPENRTAVVEHIAALFRRQVQQRCDTMDVSQARYLNSDWRQLNPEEYVFYQSGKEKVAQAAEPPLNLVLSVAPGIGSEGFKIEDGPPRTVRIIGNDPRGLLYGVGKFLRSSRFNSKGFVAGNWRGTSIPEKPIRGLYLATHFHNFYHDAPIEEVERYVEDCGLWGFNTILVWCDMHHFQGFDDPKAAELRERLHRIYQTARGIGLGNGLLIVSNEGYGNSPAEIRADPKGTRSGVCLRHLPAQAGRPGISAGKLPPIVRNIQRRAA